MKFHGLKRPMQEIFLKSVADFSSAPELREMIIPVEISLQSLISYLDLMCCPCNAQVYPSELWPQFYILLAVL